MSKSFASGLLGGVTAAVIWFAAADIFGVTGNVGLIALALLVVTTIVATLIAARVGATHAGWPRGARAPPTGG